LTTACNDTTNPLKADIVHLKGAIFFVRRPLFQPACMEEKTSVAVGASREAEEESRSRVIIAPCATGAESYGEGLNQLLLGRRERGHYYDSSCALCTPRANVLAQMSF